MPARLNPVVAAVPAARAESRRKFLLLKFKGMFLVMLKLAFGDQIPELAAQPIIGIFRG